MLLLIPTTTTIKPIIDLCDVKCNQNNRLSVLITGLSVILLLISLIAISESYLDQSKTICHFHLELGSDQKLPPGPFWV